MSCRPMERNALATRNGDSGEFQSKTGLHVRCTFTHAFAGRLTFSDVVPLTFAEIEALCGISA